MRGDVQSNPLDKDDHILPPNGKSIIENKYMLVFGIYTSGRDIHTESSKQFK